MKKRKQVDIMIDILSILAEMDTYDEAIEMIQALNACRSTYMRALWRPVDMPATTRSDIAEAVVKS